jgi:transcription elongation factor GreA
MGATPRDEIRARFPHPRIGEQSDVAHDVVLTPEGKERLERELEQLRGGGRQEIAERLRHALEIGGRELAENAEYLAAKEAQARLEQRIASIEARLEAASVAKRLARGGTIDIGAHVRVRDQDARKAEEYDIVGSGEGDPAAGRVSRESPIGSALLGHREGDVVEIKTPAGVRRLKILAVR